MILSVKPLKKLPRLSSKGFTLLEMTVVIGIIGILLGAFLAFYSPMKMARERAVTQMRIDKVLDAVSAYALQHNDLPFAAADQGGAETNNRQKGFVPYAELGLTRAEASDAYGRVMTYVVASEATSALRSQANNGTGFDTFAAVTAVDDNRSQFCYSGTKPYFQSAETPTGITRAAGFTVNRNGVAETGNAFVAVIAHGPKGPDMGTTQNADERNNVDPAFTTAVNIRDYSPRDGANHFDDQVSYLTGPSVVSRLGNTNCHDYTETCTCADVCRLFEGDKTRRYTTATSCSMPANPAQMACTCNGTSSIDLATTPARSTPTLPSCSEMPRNAPECCPGSWAAYGTCSPTCAQNPNQPHCCESNPEQQHCCPSNWAMYGTCGPPSCAQLPEQQTCCPGNWALYGTCEAPTCAQNSEQPQCCPGTWATYGTCSPPPPPPPPSMPICPSFCITGWMCNDNGSVTCPTYTQPNYIDTFSGTTQYLNCMRSGPGDDYISEGMPCYDYPSASCTPGNGNYRLSPPSTPKRIRYTSGIACQ